MSTPVIPESAPFNTQQRAWLNGFFAGLLSGNTSAHGDASSGTALLAVPSVAPATNGHIEEEEFPWHDSSLPLADRLQLAEGKPVERRLMAAMAQLNCGACGYLCQTYSEAIARGEEKDFTRCSPGGSDTVKALKQIWSTASVTTATVVNGTAKPVNGHAVKPAAAANGTSVKYGRSNPYFAKLKESVRLTHAEAPKDTRHVVIDLMGSGITYEAGDSLGILPLNEPELVQEVLTALGKTGEEVIPTLEAGNRPLRDFLLADVTLTRVRGPLLDLLAKSATNELEAKLLQEVCEQDGHELQSADVGELLARFPSARPALEEFLAALPKLQPRLYSISSSQKAHPQEVHLTIGVVRFESAGRWRNGVASHFLGVRSLPGDPIRTFIQPSKFRLPEDSKTPIIMVGPGTGIAPFRAFLEDRAESGAPGKNWLLFGNQYQAYDYLYQQQIEEFQKRGVLTKLDLAFSRDKSEKIYVQHRMLEQGAEMWKWLEEGAHFYVCGDAKRMAQDVDHALQQIVIEHGGKTPEEAKAYLTQLLKNKRYQKDVY